MFTRASATRIKTRVSGLPMIKSEKYSQLGFWKLSENGIPLNPVHWFQFADDAAVISGHERANQLLLNRFTLWCQWSDMLIRVDKCSTFGIKKETTRSVQYLPKLFLNNLLVPRVPIGESFRYLGRYFDYISQTPVEIYEKTNGKACLSCALAHG